MFSKCILSEVNLVLRTTISSSQKGGQHQGGEGGGGDGPFTNLAKE